MLHISVNLRKYSLEVTENMFCALTVIESERSSSEPALLMLFVEEVELVEFGILAF